MCRENPAFRDPFNRKEIMYPVCFLLSSLVTGFLGVLQVLEG